ncbi:hypothetical protein EDB87DRAFT_1825790 [Lactarius vividus]|nr:hypothetical protein EDB87DRAFT_1825790 [Lactarius vividus]
MSNNGASRGAGVAGFSGFTDAGRVATERRRIYSPAYSGTKMSKPSEVEMTRTAGVTAEKTNEPLEKPPDKLSPLDRSDDHFLLRDLCDRQLCMTASGLANCANGDALVKNEAILILMLQLGLFIKPECDRTVSDRAQLTRSTMVPSFSKMPSVIFDIVTLFKRRGHTRYYRESLQVVIQGICTEEVRYVTLKVHLFVSSESRKVVAGEIKIVLTCVSDFQPPGTDARSLCSSWPGPRRPSGIGTGLGREWVLGGLKAKSSLLAFGSHGPMSEASNIGDAGPGLGIHWDSQPRIHASELYPHLRNCIHALGTAFTPSPWYLLARCDFIDPCSVPIPSVHVVVPSALSIVFFPLPNYPLGTGDDADTNPSPSSPRPMYLMEPQMGDILEVSHKHWKLSLAKLTPDELSPSLGPAHIPIKDYCIQRSSVAKQERNMIPMIVSQITIFSMLIAHLISYATATRGRNTAGEGLKSINTTPLDAIASVIATSSIVASLHRPTYACHTRSQNSTGAQSLPPKGSQTTLLPLLLLGWRQQ